MSHLSLIAQTSGREIQDSILSSTRAEIICQTGDGGGTGTKAKSRGRLVTGLGAGAMCIIA